jgi:hypothetical protein
MGRIRLSVDQVEELVEKGVEEIAITAASLADAAPRAGRFLVRVAILTDFLRDVEDDSPRYQTQVNMTYNQAIYNASGKNITEKKVEAEADPAYNKALEDQGKHESMRTWVKNHIKNFDNAHVMYRQHSNSRSN